MCAQCIWTQKELESKLEARTIITQLIYFMPHTKNTFKNSSGMEIFWFAES
jgi:hypothetical protein